MPLERAGCKTESKAYLACICIGLSIVVIGAIVGALDDSKDVKGMYKGVEYEGIGGLSAMIVLIGLLGFMKLYCNNCETDECYEMREVQAPPARLQSAATSLHIAPSSTSSNSPVNNVESLNTADEIQPDDDTPVSGVPTSDNPIEDPEVVAQIPEDSVAEEDDAARPRATSMKC